MSEDFTVVGESLLPNSTMCDACGEKLRIIGKKACQRCHNHFCSKCLTLPPPPFPTSTTPHTASRHQSFCQVCLLQDLDLIERSHLVQLTTVDLRYFARRKSYNLPIGDVVKDQVVDLILAKQAKELSDRAKKALRQIATSVDRTDDAGFEGLDPSDFEPFFSAYSMTGKEVQNGGVAGARQGGVVSSDSEGAEKTTNTAGSEQSQQRKRARQDIDFSQVTSLEALTEENQIVELSVKQLKVILQRNCINYRGCVEKRELCDKVATLWRAREEEKIRQATIAQMGNVDVESEYLCKVCMDAPVDCVLLECGHMLTCVKCGRQLSECPICRQYVTRVVHAFRV